MSAEFSGRFSMWLIVDYVVGRFSMWLIVDYLTRSWII